MKLYVLILLTISTLCVSQTLFENTDSVGNQGQLKINEPKAIQSSVKIKPSQNRFVSTDLLAVILQGDIQANYERPLKDQWATMYRLSINPQSAFNDITGSVGVFTGVRRYFNSPIQSADIFLQGLAGFHYIDSLELCLIFDVGQRFNLADHFFLDVSTSIVRSYDDSLETAVAYLKFNVGYQLDSPLHSFL